MYKLMETGSAKWIKIIDGKTRYTSDKDDATVFTDDIAIVLVTYAELARWDTRETLRVIDV